MSKASQCCARRNGQSPSRRALTKGLPEKASSFRLGGNSPGVGGRGGIPRPHPAGSDVLTDDAATHLRAMILMTGAQTKGCANGARQYSQE